MDPIVSVLLPVRNGGKHLAEALASILDGDGLQPIEVIAIDDGSDDDSYDQLTAHAGRDPRLRPQRTAPVGIVAALNLALAAARAPIVARLDADDRSLPGRLAAELGYLDAHPQVAAVGTAVAVHPDGDDHGGMARYIGWLNGLPGGDLTADIWIESPLAHPTLAARRGLLVELGGYRHGPFPEDYELLLRLHTAGARIARLDEVLYWWRDHPARLTRVDPRYSLRAFRDLKCNYLRRGPLAGHSQVTMWGAGKTGRAFAAALARIGIAIGAWIDVDPRLIGTTLHGARIHGHQQLRALAADPILVAVGAAGARRLIRAELDRQGLTQSRDYWVVA